MQMYNIRAEFIPVNFDIPAKLIDKTIQANGVYNASDDNADGYSSVTVIVPDRPVLVQELNITPSTQAQTINITSGIDGYGPVNVSAVTSSIDANIQPENIIKGKSILGVNGSFYGLEKQVNNGVFEPTKPDHIIDLTGVTTIGEYQLAKAYYNDNNLSGEIDLSNIQTLSEGALRSAFYGCTNITSVNMEALTSITHYSCFRVFQGCQNLTSINFRNLNSVTGDQGCRSMFYGCTNLTEAIFDNLTSISGESSCYEMFFGLNSLQTISFNKLETISGRSGCYSMFSNCSGLTTIAFPSLTKLIGVSNDCYSMFQGCTNLSNANLNSLYQISSGSGISLMFSGCSNLSSVNFDSLAIVSGGSACSETFKNCTSLTTLSFPALRTVGSGSRNNQFSNIISGVAGCTIHFPKNLDPQSGSTTISSLTTYPNFGGTNTTLVFDLPSTHLLTGTDTVVYERNPKLDTATALCWRATTTTPTTTTVYYTSGLTDPTVGTTIYSDAECTTAVTTVDSIS